VAKRRRRFWSDEEKRRIVAQTRVPGVSVSQVARRYDVNANLVFKWLRDPRFRPGPDDRADASFLPAEIVADVAPPVVASGAAAERSTDEATFLPVEVIGAAAPSCGERHGRCGDPAGLIEIELASGHRLRVTGVFDADAVAQLARRLGA